MTPEKYNPKDILKTYARNSVDGKRNLKENKIDVSPSKEHWDKMWREALSPAFVFDETSIEKVRSQVIEKVLSIGKKTWY